MSDNAQEGHQEGGPAFRLTFRATVSVGILICLLVAMDEMHQPIHRIAAGLGIAAGAFMFYAVGRPGRLYASSIGTFCLLLGGFGAVTCLLDTQCIPRDRALWILAAAAVLACSLWAMQASPARSLPRYLSAAAAIAGASVVVYLSPRGMRAFTGSLLFLAIGLAALWFALSPSERKRAQENSKSPQGAQPEL